MTNQPIIRERTDAQTAARLRLILVRLTRAVRQHGAADLTPSQLSALSTIEDFGPLRLSDLATRESIGPSVATRVVASLEDLGYVQRKGDATDRRAFLIDLTSAGRAILTSLWGQRDAGLNARIAQLKTADVELLLAALPVLENLARERDAKQLGLKP
ncbi:putative HTH-type transcriptional regulator YusO [mine drainage metagenome]|uniref:Putative HTH-type transcriptional regulator YusO n=1 Tax=mine drainage metagenome TaxID=410659 RepID=A0A1J5R5Z4_9ZZZZ